MGLGARGLAPCALRSVSEAGNPGSEVCLPAEAAPEVAVTEVLDRPATAGADDEGRARQAALRTQFRSLQDMEARQRAIMDELAQIDQIEDPGEDDLAWQNTLILEHDGLYVIAAEPRKRSKDMARLRAAHADPANREGPDPVRTPDLATRNVIGQNPFADLERALHGLVEPGPVRGWALDA